MCLYLLNTALLSTYLFHSLTHSLFTHSLTHPFTYFKILYDLDKVNYLLKADNYNNCKIVGKYIYLEFKKGKRCLAISFQTNGVTVHVTNSKLLLLQDQYLLSRLRRQNEDILSLLLLFTHSFTYLIIITYFIYLLSSHFNVSICMCT